MDKNQTIRTTWTLTSDIDNKDNKDTDKTDKKDNNDSDNNDTDKKDIRTDPMAIRHWTLEAVVYIFYIVVQVSKNVILLYSI